MLHVTEKKRTETSAQPSHSDNAPFTRTMPERKKAGRMPQKNTLTHDSDQDGAIRLSNKEYEMCAMATD